MNTPTASVDPRIAHTRHVAVQAAAELLVECGFERVIVAAMSKRCGVARSTIYRNWPDLVELLIAGLELLCGFTETPHLGSLEAELGLLGEDLSNGLTNTEWGRVLPLTCGVRRIR